MDSKATALMLTTTVAATAIGAAVVAKSRAKKMVESPIFPGLPYPSGAHWLLGHLIMLNGNGNFMEGYNQVFEKDADPESGLCSFWFFTAPSISVLLGKHVKAVLNGSSFRKGVALLDNHMHNFLGSKALVALMGKEWKLYRSAVSLLFPSGDFYFIPSHRIFLVGS